MRRALAGRGSGARQPAGSSRRQFSGSATPGYEEAYRRSIEMPEQFWTEQGTSLLHWRREFSRAKGRECLQTGAISWFEGGRLNVAENCVDRHVDAGNGDRPAIIWERDEPGETQVMTYAELQAEVAKFTNVLLANGVGGPGSARQNTTVTLYMPVAPLSVCAMLACARLGVPHSIVFAGFSSEALASRIVDAGSELVITADEGVRGGKKIPLKETVDHAINLCPSGQVKRVLVYRRTGAEVPMTPGRDVDLEAELKAARPVAPSVDAESEDPLFRLYTSGSTGKPKGVIHSSAGFLAYAALTHREVFGYQDGDVYACVADIGWITGHTYAVYGPLANGATTVLFESIPTYPDASRYWEMVERLKINQFYTAPTAIRLLMKEGDAPVNKYDLSSLRVLGSVGEPINPEAHRWYSSVVGGGRCPIVDTWWQTETGGIQITPLPGCTDAQPGAATRPFYGVSPVLLDASSGEELKGNGVEGVLALKGTTPGFARTLAGDHDRFLETYFRPYPGYYFTGDGARRDDKGHIWITGRVDDVINVSGHRIGTAEVESALVAHPAVAEAAVVSIPHDVKGEGIYAYVVPTQLEQDGGDPNTTSEEDLTTMLRTEVRSVIGPFAAPDVIQIVNDLPKTRSGKIMRRILRKIGKGDGTSDLGDLSTLAEPAVVEIIARGAKPLKQE